MLSNFLGNIQNIFVLFNKQLAVLFTLSCSGQDFLLNDFYLNVKETKVLAFP